MTPNFRTYRQKLAWSMNTQYNGIVFHLNDNNHEENDASNLALEIAKLRSNAFCHINTDNNGVIQFLNKSGCIILNQPMPLSKIREDNLLFIHNGDKDTIKACKKLHIPQKILPISKYNQQINIEKIESETINIDDISFLINSVSTSNTTHSKYTANPQSTHITLSVILPTCDRPDRLTTAINSINQSEIDGIEIVVIDDGNPEKHIDPSLISNSKHKIKLIKTQGYQGVSKARNFGINQSSGQWIVFLDDDDEFLPTYLSQLVSHIDNETTSSFFFSGVIFRDISKPYRCDYFRYIDPKTMNNTEIRDLSSKIGTSFGLCIKKETYLSLGHMDESLIVGEDTDLILKLLTAEISPKIIPGVSTICATNNKESLSYQLKKSSKYDIFEKIIEKHQVFLNKNKNMHLNLLSSSIKCHKNNQRYLKAFLNYLRLLKLLLSKNT